jgi:hypothetical protein
MGAPVPFPDTPATVPVGDPVEAARRFRRFVLLDLGAAVAGSWSSLAVLLWSDALAWPLLVAAVVCVALLPGRCASTAPAGRRRRPRGVRDVLAAAGRRAARRPVAVRAVRGPHVFPVLFAIPYVQRRTLFLVSVVDGGRCARRRPPGDASYRPRRLGAADGARPVVFFSVSVVFLASG